MEPKSIPTTFHHHHRRSSSDRFLGIFSSSPPSTNTTDSGGDDHELNEDEILWTGDFAETNHHSGISTTTTITTANNHRSSFPSNSGILAALPEFNHHSILYRKPSISATPSSSKLIPSSIPRPPQDYGIKSQSMPSRKLQQSAPMNVSALSTAMAMEKQRNNKFFEVDDEKGDDEMMLPPHEIVARGSGRSPRTTFSVLEGVGRTLKGRDLRQVRNAVWRETGFLDS